MIRRPQRSTRTDTLFPYTTLFRSGDEALADRERLAGVACRDRDLRQAARERGGRLHMVGERFGASGQRGIVTAVIGIGVTRLLGAVNDLVDKKVAPARSEGRRVGTECGSTYRSRWAPDP